MSDLYRRLLRELTGKFGSEIDDANADAIAYAAADLYHRDFEPRLWEERTAHELLDLFGIPRAGSSAPYSLSDRFLLLQRRSSQAQYVTRAHEVLTTLGVPRKDESGADQNLKWRLDRFLESIDATSGDATEVPPEVATATAVLVQELEAASPDGDGAAGNVAVDEVEEVVADESPDAGETEPVVDEEAVDEEASAPEVADVEDVEVHEEEPEAGGDDEELAPADEATNEATSATDARIEDAASSADADEVVEEPDADADVEEAAEASAPEVADVEVDGQAEETSEVVEEAPPEAVPEETADVVEDEAVEEPVVEDVADDVRAEATGLAPPTDDAEPSAGVDGDGEPMPSPDTPSTEAPSKPTAQGRTPRAVKWPLWRRSLSAEQLAEAVGEAIEKAASPRPSRVADGDVDHEKAPPQLAEAVRALGSAARMEEQLDAGPDGVDLVRLSDTLRGIQGELAHLREMVQGLEPGSPGANDTGAVAAGPVPVPEAAVETRDLPPVAADVEPAPDLEVEEEGRGRRSLRRVLLVLLVVVLGILLAGGILVIAAVGWDELRAQVGAILLS
jgi:hypothetical protein